MQPYASTSYHTANAETRDADNNPSQKASNPTTGYGQCQLSTSEKVISLPTKPDLDEEPITEMPLRAYTPRQRLLLVAS